jgi:hypothetical protein
VRTWDYKYDFFILLLNLETRKRERENITNSSFWLFIINLGGSESHALLKTTFRLARFCF